MPGTGIRCQAPKPCTRRGLTAIGARTRLTRHGAARRRHLAVDGAAPGVAPGRLRGRGRPPTRSSSRGRTVLVDPLAPEGDDGFWERLDGVVPGEVVVARSRSAITCAAPRRSARATRARPCGGIATSASRMTDPAAFRELAPGSAPAGVRAYAIGRPRRAELPVLVESHRALAFGDAVVGTDDGLRMWCNRAASTSAGCAFYADRFAAHGRAVARGAVRPRAGHARPGGRLRRAGGARGGAPRAALVPPRLG